MKRIFSEEQHVTTTQEDTEDTERAITLEYMAANTRILDCVRQDRVEDLAHILNHTELVSQLGTLNLRDGEDNTLWHLAFKFHRLDVLKLLYDTHAKHLITPDQENKRGKLPLEMTSFYYAAEDWDIVKKIMSLCSMDNNIKVRDEEENTLLHYAASMNDRDMVSKLLEKKPGLVDKDNIDLDSPIDFAVKHSSYAALEAMLKITNKSLQHEDGILVHTAIKEDAEKIIRLLMKYGHPVNTQSGEGNTPLHVAVQERSLDIVRMLVEEYKCDTEIRNEKGQTPFDLAVTEDDIYIIEYFLEREISTNRELSTNKELSLLAQIYLSVVNDKLEELKALLPHIEERVMAAETYLDMLWVTAINKKSYEIIKYMLEQGVDANESLNDYSDDYPLHIAIKTKDERLVKLLLEVPNINPHIIVSEEDTLLIEAIELGSTEILKFLWEKDNSDFRKLLPTVWKIAQGTGNKDIDNFLLDILSVIFSENVNIKDDSELKIAGEQGNADTSFNDEVWIHDFQNYLS